MTDENPDEIIRSLFPKAPTTDDIDARSECLLEEFKNHAAEVTVALRRKHPELVEPDEALHLTKLYQGWATQKIAGLQLFVEYQEALIDRLLNRK